MRIRRPPQQAIQAGKTEPAVTTKPPLPELKIGPVVPAEPGDPEWAALADEWEKNALPNARAVAEKWAGSITALLGIFGIAGFIKGRDDVADLTPHTRAAVAVLLAVALASGVAAVFLASLAAQGGVKRLQLPTARRLREWSNERVGAIAWQLAASRLLSLLAVTSFALAVGFIWFGHRATVATLRVTPTHGKPVCGELKSSRGGTITLKVTGRKKTYLLTALRTIEAVRSCDS